MKTRRSLKGYHTATSEAEKVQDSILRLSDKDDNMLHYVLHTPNYKPKADKGYAGHFTQRLLRDMAEMVLENGRWKIDSVKCNPDK